MSDFSFTLSKQPMMVDRPRLRLDVLSINAVLSSGLAPGKVYMIVIIFLISLIVMM